jgi:MFS family permease
MNRHVPPEAGDPGSPTSSPVTPQPEPITRDQVTAIAAAIACVTVVGIGISLSVPLLSLEMERMGASGVVIGLNTAIAGVASIAVVPFVPRLAARTGVLPLLWGSVILGAATLLLFEAFYSLAAWFPIRFVFSACLGTLFVLSEYWINTAAPPHRRGLVMGIYATVLALGFAIGPALLVFVGTSGWGPYLAGAGLFLLAALPLLLARGLQPDLHGHASRGVGSFILAAPTATVAALIYGAIETGAFSILPIYGLRLGLGEGQAAALVTWVSLGNVMFQIPLGLLADRVNRRALLAGIAAFSLGGALLIPVVAGSPTAFILVLFVWGGVAGALYTVGLSHLGASFTGPDLASANAAFVILYNVGLILGPPVIGAGMDLSPPHGFAYALAGFFALYLAIVGARMLRGRAPAGPRA